MGGINLSAGLSGENAWLSGENANRPVPADWLADRPRSAFSCRFRGPRVLRGSSDDRPAKSSTGWVR